MMNKAQKLKTLIELLEELIFRLVQFFNSGVL